MATFNQFINRLRKRYHKFKKNLNTIKGQNNSIDIHKSSSVIAHWNIRGNNIKVIIGKNCHIENIYIHIYGDNHCITIGDQVIIEGGELWIEDNYCNIRIGNRTSIGSAHIAVTEDNSMVTIGEDCMFSTEIEIRTGDSHAIIDLETKQKINSAKSIVIEDHVWIGKRVCILKGVHIGTNCIIGTSSIITKSIPAYSTAVGIPAKTIKTGVTWKRDRY